MSASTSATWPYPASHSDVKGAWQIGVGTDPEAVKDDWLRLSEEGHTGPFQTFGWVSAWYKATERFGLAEPLILTGSRRADGRPDIIMPLCRYLDRGRIIISAPDLEVSDLYEPVLSKAATEDGDALSTFFRQARKRLPAHDLLTISKLEASRDGKAPPLAHPRYLARLPYSAWSMKLDLSKAEDAGNLFKPKMRRTVRQKINRLTELAERALVFESDLSGSDALDVIWNMRADRFSAVNRPDGLKQDAWRLLYDEVCAGRHPDLKPFSAVLTCNHEPVGGQLGILHKSHFVGTLLSFKMGEYDRYSPGLQIVYESIKHLAGAGVTNFDLSVGDQPYKRQLGCTPRPLYELMVPGSLKGLALWAAWRGKNSLRTHPKLFNAVKLARGLAKTQT